LERIRQNTWLETALIFLHEHATLPNLVGLVGGVCALFLLIVLRDPWNYRLSLYLVILTWTILCPRVALYLMPFAVPWGSLDIINIAGLNLNSADILVVFLGVGWLMSYALRPRLSHRGSEAGSHEAGPRDRVSAASSVPPYLIFAIIVLIGTMLLSMLAAINISSSLKEVSKWLEFLVLVLVGTQYIRTRRQVWTIIVLVCLAGITQAIFGYLQAFFSLGPEAFIRDASLRVYGTFGQPNPYAGYINIPLSIALALMLLGSNWRTRILAGITALSLAAAEALTQSRGGEFAISVTLLFIVILGMPRLRKPLALLALAGLGFVELFFAGWIPTYVLTPLLKNLGLVQISFTNPSAADYSTAERLAHWWAGVRMFLDHPLIGTGIGNYPDAYPRYFVTIFVNSLGHAHNYYINIAAETGSLGLTAFLLFLMAMFIAGGSSYQSISKKYMQAKATGQAEIQKPFSLRDKLNLLLRPVSMVHYYQSQGMHTARNILRNDKALAVGLLGALLSVCVHNLLDDLYVHSLTNLIALLLLVLIRLEGVTTNVRGNGG
jgi:O-antigen ligase